MVAILSVGLGFHWAAIQSAAWMGMLVAYSSEGSFTEAVQKTFDGHHPCRLCKLVADGKKSEQGGNNLVPSKLLKLDGVVAREELLHRPLSAALLRFVAPALRPSQSISTPRPPPPRVA